MLQLLTAPPPSLRRPGPSAAARRSCPCGRRAPRRGRPLCAQVRRHGRAAPAMRGAGGGPTLAACAARGGRSGPLRRAHGWLAFLCSAAATAEIKSLGPDRWNDTYYPSGADAANVHKQWCAAASWEADGLLLLLHGCAGRCCGTQLDRLHHCCGPNASLGVPWNGLACSILMRHAELSLPLRWLWLLLPLLRCCRPCLPHCGCKDSSAV